MRRFIILCCAAVILASCSKVTSSKVKSIISFTPPLEVEADATPVVLPHSKKASEWHEGVSWVNSQPENFETKEISSKFDSHNIVKGGSLIAAPAQAEGKIFAVSSGGVVSAYDLQKRKIVWYTNLDRKSGLVHYKGGVVYDSGRIYVTSASRDLVALDTKSGVIIWRHKMPDVVKCQPLVHKSSVFVTTVGNDLYAVDKENGTLLWQNDGANETLSASRDIVPVIYKDKIITCYSSGDLVAADLKTGETVWDLNVATLGGNLMPGFIPVSLESQPIIDSSSIYVATGNGILMKVNADSGAVEWQKKIYDIHSMNKSGNSLFVTTNAMQVAAINSKTGKVVWATNLFSKEELSEKKNKNPVTLLTPVVLNSDLYVLSDDRKLYKLSPQDGKILSVIEVTKKASYFMIADSLRIFTERNILVFEEKTNGSKNR
ncbi:MAG: PQQ-like beta-propeller repeat protein [Rickettsiaceae bacterium]|nr:PQQ-like beta-propeller repeat protein [Rickettsiaceae bacterium]